MPLDLRVAIGGGAMIVGLVVLLGALVFVRGSRFRSLVAGGLLLLAAALVTLIVSVGFGPDAAGAAPVHGRVPQLLRSTPLRA